MNLIDRRKIYLDAVNCFGLTAQLGMLQEEAAEVIQVVNKLRRNGVNDSGTIIMLAEEMADLEIMMEQIRYAIDWMELDKKIIKAKTFKLQRLDTRVRAHKEFSLKEIDKNAKNAIDEFEG